MTARRLVIVGAGPIGLHAALRAATDGYDVSVLERGSTGAAISRWSHVRLFTPFSMNSTVSGRLAAGISTNLPNDDELLTGADYINRYLRPLAESPLLAGCIHEFSEVVAAGRHEGTKSSWVGRPERARSPFRILVRYSNDRYDITFADILLDCSGLTERNRFIGAGGIPCPGETTLLRDEDYRIASGTTVNDSDEHIVVVGSGYSAATSVCSLQESTRRITWITRGDRSVPIEPVPDDRLPERAALTEKANRFALSDSSSVTWLPGRLIDAIEELDSGFVLKLTDPDGTRQQLACDRIVANPGYRPDTRPFEELQIHRCYATEGPIKMAAHLLSDSSKDCLGLSIPGPDLLRNPEPGFFILGAASYGRSSRFLLENGLAQIDQLFDVLIPSTDVSL